MEIMNILVSILSGGIVSAIIVFSAKTYISQRVKHEYDAKLEEYKSRLKLESEREIERLRSDLTIMAYEREVRFAAFHEECKKVVAETYARLQRYRSAVGRYTKTVLSKDDPPIQERRANLDTKQKEFWDFFYVNELYFSDELSSDIRSIADLLYQESRNHFLVHEDDAFSPMEKMKLSEQCEALREAEGKLFTETKRKMQQLIGVPPAEKVSADAEE